MTVCTFLMLTAPTSYGLGAFTKSQKAPVSYVVSFRLPVYLSACIDTASTKDFLEISYRRLLLNSV